MRRVGLVLGEPVDLLPRNAPRATGPGASTARGRAARSSLPASGSARASRASRMRCGLVEIEQREAVGASQAVERPLDAVPVGVGLDDGPDARVRAPPRGRVRCCGRRASVWIRASMGRGMREFCQRLRRAADATSSRGATRRPACYKAARPLERFPRRGASQGGLDADDAERMKRGFYTIMSAQFFSSLADNALFVAAIELLKGAGAAEWQRAALVPMFALFYVVLAPLVGAFADAVPKGKVMFYSNAHQGGRLPDDAVRRPSADRLRDRRPRRRGLLAGQVRHPDRAAADLAAGQGQRLDRGPDDPVDHPGRACWAASWSARRSRRYLLRVRPARSSTSASTRRAQAAIAVHGRCCT